MDYYSREYSIVRTMPVKFHYIMNFWTYITISKHMGSISASSQNRT